MGIAAVVNITSDFLSAIVSSKVLLEASKRKEEKDSVSARFVRLFESHGVSRNQIPRVFKHGLTLVDVDNDGILLEKLSLDDSIIEDACNIFAIRREWLDGASPQVYPLHFFYREPDTVIKYIEKLNIIEGEFATQLFVFKPATKSLNSPALLIFQERIGMIDNNPDNPFYRYHLCSEHYYSSYKDRPYLAAIIASCSLRGILIRGFIVSEKVIMKIASGETIPPLPLTKEVEDIWHPDDITLEPKVFLDGISYGKHAALKLWLELESKGCMKLGIGSKKEIEARQLFEQELKNISI
jgi:hypothetical protein